MSNLDPRKRKEKKDRKPDTHHKIQASYIKHKRQKQRKERPVVDNKHYDTKQTQGIQETSAQTE